MVTALSLASYQVKQFYTAPTAIRSLMRSGDSHVQKHKRDSLQILGTVGEPINPEAWRWYHDVVSSSSNSHMGKATACCHHSWFVTCCHACNHLPLAPQKCDYFRDIA